jgi:uncharacterized SAM-binding protein YcdF (DUF218 family)
LKAQLAAHPRQRQLLIGTGLILGVGFFIATAVALFVFLYGNHLREPLPAASSADAIIVLGGGTYRNGRPNNAQSRRVMHAVLLYQRGVAPYILCTGALDRPDYVKSEAQACVDEAIAQGVPANAILREDSSTNTEQNLIQSKLVLAANHLTTVVIVSDSFHLFRTEQLVAHYGLSVTAYSPAQATQGPLPLIEGTLSCYREFGAMIFDTVRIAVGG